MSGDRPSKFRSRYPGTVSAGAPPAHTHAGTDITSALIAQARLGTGSTGAGTKVLYDDQTFKTPSGGSGSGDVVGPASAVNLDVAVFDGTTGKLIKDGGTLLSALATTSAVAAGYQPLDSDLTAIAALTTTSFGRALLALVDQAALTAAIAGATTTLPGISELATSAETITGTDTVRTVTPAGAAAAYQPLDSDLTAVAALTTTSYGRAFLALANQAALVALLPSYQPLDSDLTTIAGLTATTDNFMVANASAWASRTPAQAKTSLALAKADVGLGSVDNTADAAKNVLSATKLTTARTLNGTSFDGTANVTFDYRPGGTDVAITDGGTGVSTLPSGLLKGAGTSAITAATAGTDYYAPGGTDVAVADGGTGASTAAAARTNLGVGLPGIPFTYKGTSVGAPAVASGELYYYSGAGELRFHATDANGSDWSGVYSFGFASNVPVYLVDGSGHLWLEVDLGLSLVSGSTWGISLDGSSGAPSGFTTNQPCYLRL